MSKTDKDRPYWVRCNDPLENRYEHHTCGREKRSAYGKPREDIECSIDIPQDRARSWWYDHPCVYFLHEKIHRINGVPKWFVDYVWNNPERTRVRDDLRELAKEYNATLDIDDYDFPNYQHRNQALWYWD